MAACPASIAGLQQKTVENRRYIIGLQQKTNNSPKTEDKY
jgi:hypothetical protein